MNRSRSLSIAFAIMAVGASVVHAQQQLDWQSYCTLGSDPLCSSIFLTLTPDGGSTDFSIQLQNLEGTLGATPFALYNVTFAGLGVNLADNGAAFPTFQASFSGSADYDITADAQICAEGVVGGCPGSNWGYMEWDWDTNGGMAQLGSHIDQLPKPFGIVGCDAPAQPDQNTSSYWGAGYFQTCGDGAVDFDFALPGTWMFDDRSTLSVLLYDGTDMSTCVFGQTCLQAQTTATPEPTTFSLLATGVAFIIGIAYRRRQIV